jgi:prevent-host-death family protein
MVEAHWQVQDAKQRFGELIRQARSHGVQFITRHGAEVAVVLDIDDYRRLGGQSTDFKQYLLAGPHPDELVVERSRELPRSVDLSDSE